MTAPKVTIGLMVYNESVHVRSALNSILEQSFADYEILVGDNLSSDGTTEIIAEYASAEPRIRHIIHDRNIGAIQNWNTIVSDARGKYFVLAGGHDLWTNDYLEKLVSHLEASESTVLAFAKTQWIDDAGARIDKPTSLIDTSGMPQLHRHIAVMITNQHYLYGLIRVSALKKTKLQKEILGSGEIFLQELTALGSFAFVEGPRWFRRENRMAESDIARLERYEKILFSGEFQRRKFRLFPYLQMLFWYLAVPFVLKETSWTQRVAIITLYPYLLFRFLPKIRNDLKWLYATLSR